VTLYRCFAWNERARPNAPDGPLWFPRMFQGDGRHDNPDVYGCLYLADRESSAVVEQLARFRGTRLVDAMLVRRGLPLALAAIELPDRAQLIDLDDPKVLETHELRPSLVATRRREVTQPQALALYRRHRFAAGLRWWSTFEALWANTTVFERASGRLRLAGIRKVTLDDSAVAEASAFLGLA
jgi:hypothetical protein